MGGSLPKTAQVTSQNVENLNRSSQSWFALRVKSRCEKAVAAMAHSKGFEEFLPVYRCRRTWSDRLKSVELPLFPGYVFCRLDPLHRLPLLTTPGVLHLVGIGRTPIPIDEGEIASIRIAVQSGLSIEPWTFLECGQRVRLEKGPLAGLEGIFTGDSNEERVVVSVSLLKRSMAVTIKRKWVTPLDAKGRQIALETKNVASLPIR